MKSFCVFHCLIFSIFFSTNIHAGAFAGVADTIYYAPVCGSNGKTYINAAAARADGISDWVEGHCLPYSEVQSLNPDTSWISDVEVNDMIQSSTYDEGGYTDYTHVIFELYAEGENKLYLNSQQPALPCAMSLSVWIDFNENHQFEAEELVLQTNERSLAAPLLLAESIKTDYITRMRVCLAPSADEVQGRVLEMGEVEDYSVLITK